MGNLVTIARSWVCLVFAGVAACTSGTPENESAGNANFAVAGEAENATANGTEVNEAAPAIESNMAAATPGNAAGAAAYSASGTEPFWSLTLGSQMTYHPADGPDISVATPHSSPTRVGPMYATPKMTVRINQFQRCTEASGKEVHDTVTVTIGTQELRGCGEGNPPD
ncbi:MAG: heat shock protein HslJ [Sphingomonadales bacterium]|jgi:uncharacterized membrane protein|nr:heat shock protein HslJ [Sphingomonadales bacterium]